MTSPDPRCPRCDRPKATEETPITQLGVCRVEYGVGDTECMEAMERRISRLTAERDIATAAAGDVRGRAERAEESRENWARTCAGHEATIIERDEHIARLERVVAAAKSLITDADPDNEADNRLCVREIGDESFRALREAVRDLEPKP